MGTDNLGRSVWELVVNGARLSVAFGLVTMLIAVLIGVTLVSSPASGAAGRTPSSCAPST